MKSVMSIIFLFLFSFLSPISGDEEFELPFSIQRLDKKLAEIERIESTLEKRRLLKRTIRSGESLLRKYPQGDYYYHVLFSLFECRKQLYIIKESEQNLKDLLDICQKLSTAPDALALLRLPADALLTEIKIGQVGGDKNKVSEILNQFISMHESLDTEEENLMLATTMAMDNGQSVILQRTRALLNKRFGEKPEVVSFMRERFGITKNVFTFSGEFTRADGSVMKFPNDRIGTPYLACFWSTEVVDLEDKLLEIKAVQEKYKNYFEVYSFNLDERKDHGKAILKRYGLNWIPMRLNNGLKNKAYLKYARFGKTPFAFVVVNEMGWAKGKSNRSNMPSIEEDVKYILSPSPIGLRGRSYYVLLDSLLTGEFLIENQTTKAFKELKEIFPNRKERMGLTREQAREMYSKANNQYLDAIKKVEDKKDSVTFRNHRIIALMGLWKLNGKKEFLDMALLEAKQVLKYDLKVGEKLIADFCVARHSIREDNKKATLVRQSFLKRNGNGYRAQAAALVLALDAGLEPGFASGLFNQGRAPWDIRDALQKEFHAKFKTMNGKTISFPKDTDGKHNLIVFVDTTLQNEEAAIQNNFINNLKKLVETHVHKEIKMLMVLLSPSETAATSFMTENKFISETIYLQGDVYSVGAISFGAYGKSIHPKTYLVDPSGTIKRVYGGLNAKILNSDATKSADFQKRTNNYVNSVKSIIRSHDASIGFQVLEQKKYVEAKKRLDPSFPGGSIASPRHSLKLYIALEKWEEALKISRKVCYRHYGTTRPHLKLGLVDDLSTRSMILRKLGQHKEAEQDELQINTLLKDAAEMWDAMAELSDINGDDKAAKRWRGAAKRTRDRLAKRNDSGRTSRIWR